MPSSAASASASRTCLRWRRSGVSDSGPPVTPSLDIVIVNWNAGPQLAACLASIEATSRHASTLSSVVVVDNASSDGSATGLALNDIDLVVLNNEQNLGFG